MHGNSKYSLVDLQPENFVLRSGPGPTPWSMRGLVLVDHGFAVRTDSNAFAAPTCELARGTALYLTHELAEYVVKGTNSSTSRRFYSYPYVRVRTTYTLSTVLSIYVYSILLSYCTDIYEYLYTMYNTILYE